MDFLNEYLEKIDNNNDCNEVTQIYEEDEDLYNNESDNDSNNSDSITKNYLINNDSDTDEIDYYADFKKNDISDNLAEKIKKEFKLKEKALAMYSDFDKNEESLFCKNTVIQIILNEINDVNDSLKYITIETIDDNIFNLSIKFNYFDNNMNLNNSLMELKKNNGYNFIEINIKLNKILYPHYPPDLYFVKPRLLNNLDYKIISMEYFNIDTWNPTNSLKYTIMSIQNILNKYGKIDYNSKIDNTYLPIELDLINLSKLTNIKMFQNNTEVKIDFVSINKYITKNNLNKDKGIGYSDNKSSKWDIKKYIKIQKERINSITNCLKIFVKI